MVVVGPVGLTLALALRKQDIVVSLVDRPPQPRDRSKALVIWPRTLDLTCRAPSGETRLHELLRSGRLVLLSVGTPLPPLDPSLVRDWLVPAVAAPQSSYRAGWVYLIRQEAYPFSCAPSAERERLLAVWEARRWGCSTTCIKEWKI